MKTTLIAVNLVIFGLASCDDRGDNPKLKDFTKKTRVQERPKPSRHEVISTAQSSALATLRGADKSTVEIDVKTTRSALMTGPLEHGKILVMSLPVGPESDALLRDFAIRYASEDLLGALRWLNEIPQEGANRSAFSQIGRLSTSDPEAALKAAQGIKDRGLLEKFGQGYMIGLSQQNQSTIENSLYNPELLSTLGLTREGALLSILAIKAKDETRHEAVSILNRYLMEGGEISPGESAENVKRITKVDQEGMKQMIESMPENGSHISDVIAPFVEQWSLSEPIKAAEWIGTQTGEKRDIAAIGLIRGIAKNEPVASAQIATSLSSSQLRYQAFSELSNRSQYEHDSIKSVIDAAEISQDEAKKLKALFNK